MGGNFNNKDEFGENDADEIVNAGIATENTLSGFKDLFEAVFGSSSIISTGSVKVIQQGVVDVAQSGTWNITNISGTISLPSGAATAANQLPDGHNVTVDNGSGVSAVNIQDGGNTITVDGTVTANLGAVDNAVLDAIAASAAVMDDWDESDRAKVNPIVGQAGVQGGSGAVSNTTQRVVLATDVALPAGTNTIGKLAANSGVDIGDVDVTSQPARDRTTDNVGVGLQTDVIMNDTTALTPKFAVIDDATSGNNTIVAAVSGKKIRVLGVFLVASADVTVRFESGANGTALTGQMQLVANTGFVLPFSPVGWFETAATTLLNLELSAAVSVDGSLIYVEV